jgi:hypothetical protein
MRISLVLLILSHLLWCANALAEDDSAHWENPWEVREWIIMTSVYTAHFDPDPDHVNSQKLIGVEAVFENDWLAGLATFDNSFGQRSQFVYMGKSWPIAHSRFWYFKLMGGLLHGYKEPYEDKIPLNGLGVAPGIIPSLGFRYKRVLAEVNLLGTAAVTVTVGVRF